MFAGRIWELSTEIFVAVCENGCNGSASSCEDFNNLWLHCCLFFTDPSASLAEGINPLKIAASAAQPSVILMTEPLTIQIT